MINYNIGLAVECVKTICDNTKCGTCDTLKGPCVRFPCGHIICQGCAETAGECFFCVSSETGSYLADTPQTNRINNASALLTAFQDTFHVDVYKRQRVSDKLKAEKQVFPECIQAPQKYCNKKRSLNISVQNIENIHPSFLPEENMPSETRIMRRSLKHVHDWLNQHDTPQNKPRKPFGDINVNTQPVIHKRKKDVVKLDQVNTENNAKQSKYRKRSYSKLKFNSTPTLLNKLSKPNIKNKNQERLDEINKGMKKFDNHNNVPRKCDKDESGIVIDAEPILVEDTETEIVDKDTLAWLAVLEEAKKNGHEDMKTVSEKNEKGHCLGDSNVEAGLETIDNINLSDKNQGRILAKVPFYKKGLLYETCMLRSNFEKGNNSCVKIGKNSNVSIVMKNSDYITTIKFTQCAEKKIEAKQHIHQTSVGIQTDIPTILSKCDSGHASPLKRKPLSNGSETPAKRLNIQSLDIFTSHKTKQCSNPESNYCKNSCNILKPPKCHIVQDSDTDSNISFDNTLEVVADVHRTSAPEPPQCGILATMSKYDYQHRSQRAIRGHTPNSTDSSDKENVDPNRNKGAKCGKKIKKEKI